MENVNLEIMTAKEFYEKSVESQREMVNVAIVKGMEYSKPIVKLPTQLYVEIADGLKALGWLEDIVGTEELAEDEGFSWIYPACLEQESDLPVVTEVRPKFIPAEKFYAATLKNQKRDLCIAFGGALDAGVSEVRLLYRAYPELIKEMYKKGWQHGVWYPNNITIEECSMFYPICGFEEEE